MLSKILHISDLFFKVSSRTSVISWIMAFRDFPRPNPLGMWDSAKGTLQMELSSGSWDKIPKLSGEREGQGDSVVIEVLIRGTQEYQSQTEDSITMGHRKKRFQDIMLLVWGWTDQEAKEVGTLRNVERAKERIPSRSLEKKPSLTIPWF